MHTYVHMLGLLMRVGAQAEYSKGLPLPLKYILMWRQRRNMQQQFAQTTAEQVRCCGNKSPRRCMHPASWAAALLSVSTGSHLPVPNWICR